MLDRTQEIIDFEEATRLLNFKPSRLRKAIYRRELPFYRLGGLLRFKRTELLAWLDSKLVKAK